MILNTLHHMICCHLSTRYCAYLKMLANFKSHGTMYSKLGYWNKATSKCTTSNFYTIKNPLFGHIWSIFHQSLLQKSGPNAWFIEPSLYKQRFLCELDPALTHLGKRSQMYCWIKKLDYFEQIAGPQIEG